MLFGELEIAFSAKVNFLFLLNLMILCFFLPFVYNKTNLFAEIFSENSNLN